MRIVLLTEGECLSYGVGRICMVYAVINSGIYTVRVVHVRFIEVHYTLFKV